METNDKSGQSSGKAGGSGAAPSHGKRPRLRQLSQGASVRRFLLIFALSFAGFMAFTYQVLYLDAVFVPWATLNGRLCALILAPFLDEVVSRGDILSTKGFSVQILRGCDSFQASAVLLAGIVAFPATWKERLVGAGLGLLFLFLLNVVRLCIMLLVGLHQRSLFDTFHTQIMPMVFVLAALGIWMLWAMKVGRGESSTVAHA